MVDIAREKALADFRYTDSKSQIVEAYQITEHTIYDEQRWPSWLKMQVNQGDTNVVYRSSDAPQSLFINMSGEEGQLGLNAWIIRGEDGSLMVMGEVEFGGFYSKVVPVPEVVPMVASDGQTDQEFYDGLDPEIIKKLKLKNPADRKPVPEPVAKSGEITMSAIDEYLPSEALVLREFMDKAIELLKGGQSKGAIKASQNLQIGLDTAASGGLQWCDCDPGACDESSKWGCRQKSPLL